MACLMLKRILLGEIFTIALAENGISLIRFDEMEKNNVVRNGRIW